MKKLQRLFRLKYGSYLLALVIGLVALVYLLIPQDETSVPYSVLNLSRQEKHVYMYFIDTDSFSHQDFKIAESRSYFGHRLRPDIDNPNDDIRLSFFYMRNESGEEILRPLGDFRAINMVICDEKRVISTSSITPPTAEEAKDLCNGKS